MKTPLGLIRQLKQLNSAQDDLLASPDTPFAAISLCQDIRAHLSNELLEAHDEIRLSGNTSVAAMVFRRCGVCCEEVDASVLVKPRLSGLFVSCPECKTLLYEMSEGCADFEAEDPPLSRK